MKEREKHEIKVFLSPQVYLIIVYTSSYIYQWSGLFNSPGVAPFLEGTQT
jgi:hypothetical protein